MWLLTGAVAGAQTVPAPSQVAPPVIQSAPSGAHIALPQVPAGAQIPAQAKTLRFKLLGFSIQGEFEELRAQREEISKPLVGRTVSVADIFEFADKLQQIYVKAGYPLVRVVIVPQEFEKATIIKIRVIDGYIERMDATALANNVRERVLAVLAPLDHKTHLKQYELERQLLIAGDTAGLVLNATFAAGKDVGGSVLVLTGRYRPVSASLYADNAMPQVFGTGQLVATASLNSLMGLGEQFTVSAAGLPDKDFFGNFPTRRYLTGIFVVPLGIDGVKLDLGGTNGVTTPRVNLSAASQGLLDQGHIKLSYDAVKLRDFELTVNGRFEATDEAIHTLTTDPATPLNVDRIRALRGGFDGIWRLRESGTTVAFGADFSKGLDGLGARTAAEAATSGTPLSRQGADATFRKMTGHLEINQALPSDFFAALMAFGQTSFGDPLVTSEQYDITGAKMVSGLTAGALPGDSAWAVRGEVGRPFAVPIESGGLVFTPYIFGVNGERILKFPTVVEVPSIHATSYGTGVRVNLNPWMPDMGDAYGFVEWSRTAAHGVSFDGTLTSFDQDRIFTGILVRY